MPTLQRIILYPIKSLDGVEVESATVSPSGMLMHDRAFAIVDGAGKYVNGKRNAKIHTIRANYTPALNSVILRDEENGRERSFDLYRSRDELEDWLSERFGFRISIQYDEGRGFPDDRSAWGPTVVGTGSLETVASWFPGLNVDGARQRFRPNIEIAGVPPFWEDRLVDEQGHVVEFRIGSVHLEGISVSARCVVPTRDPASGQPNAGFQKAFIANRRASLPSWAIRSRFDHFYRFCINTRIQPSEAGKMLKRGDEVTILGVRPSR